MGTPPDEKNGSDRADRPAPDKEARALDQRAAHVDVEHIYRTHVPDVLRHLRGGFGFRRKDGSRGHFRVHSTFDAEEICQEAFAAFFKQRATVYDPSRPPLPYILRIASFIALKRGRKRAAEVFVDAPVGQVPPVDGALRRLMDTFYDTLSPADQAIFDACFVDELSQAKAGEKLGRSRDQVYRALTRVRRAALGFFTEKGWFDGS